MIKVENIVVKSYFSDSVIIFRKLKILLRLKNCHSPSNNRNIHFFLTVQSFAFPGDRASLDGFDAFSHISCSIGYK